MTTSTTSQNKKSRIKIWTIAFWLIVWQLASLSIGQEILLVSPVSVAKKLAELVFELSFWKSIFFSFQRIVIGFLLACICGILLGGLSSKFKIMRDILAVPVAVIKSTPVVSFIILVLIWIPSKNLSVFISFLMVLPIVYTNILSGIESTDKKLIEMAEIFKVPLIKKIRYIYLSQVMPYFRSACVIGLGLCWKSGIAAEVIGIPDGSIGERLYEAKIYLDTPELFAWTVVIILVSILFEKLFLWILNHIIRIAEEM